MPIVSSSPHVVSPRATMHIMRDVLLALTPAALFGAWTSGPMRGADGAGFQPFFILIVAVAAAVLGEALIQRILKKPVTIGDLSAAVTGLLLGMSLPPTAPLWLPLVGSLLAVVLVKAFFDGLGHNFCNPALAARAMLMASWPALMTNFLPGTPDAFASATPLTALSGTGVLDHMPLLKSLLWGGAGGCIGEDCRLLLLAGGVYLLCRGVINWRIPLGFLVSYALFDRLFGNTVPLDLMLFSGGLMLGAIFMATDYVTSPQNKPGVWLYSLGCGLFVAVIRSFGALPEGVTYAILLMNAATPLLNRIERRRAVA